MRLITHKLFLASALVAATFMSVAAEAQTTLNVPFSFNVGHSLVPAGAYSVERSGAPWGGFVTLKNLQTNANFTWAVSPGDPAPTDTRIVLKFDEIGQTHLLRSVQYHSMITSRLDEDVRRNQQPEVRFSVPKLSGNKAFSCSRNVSNDDVTARFDCSATAAPPKA